MRLFRSTRGPGWLTHCQLALREARDAAERAEKKTEIRQKKAAEQEAIEKKKKEQELKSYMGLVDDEDNKVRLGPPLTSACLLTGRVPPDLEQDREEREGVRR